MEQTAQYSFTVEDTHNGKRVTYQKGKHGFAAGCLFYFVAGGVISGLFGFLIIQVLDLEQNLFLILALGFSVSILVSALFVRWRNKLRQDGVFEITPNAIIIDGKSFSRNNIHRLFIVDPRGNATRQAGTPILVGGSVAGTAAATAAQVQFGILHVLTSQVMKIKFKVKFRYGELDIVLAEGLTENSSKALFDKTKELLSFS